MSGVYEISHAERFLDNHGNMEYLFHLFRVTQMESFSVFRSWYTFGIRHRMSLLSSGVVR